MARQQLTDALDALHEELDSEAEISEADRAALLQTAREIQEALGEEGASPGEEPLSERISVRMRDFEKSHPRFAEILANVSEALANLGI